LTADGRGCSSTMWPDSGKIGMSPRIFGLHLNNRTSKSIGHRFAGLVEEDVIISLVSYKNIDCQTAQV
jgi:hypothetical protein